MTMIGYVPAKKYRVKLELSERKVLEGIRDKGATKATRYKRALALLLSDEAPSGKALSDTKICEVVGMRLRTVERLRKRCHEVGPIKALERSLRETPPVAAKITGEVEAHITQIACSEAPDGCSHWTLQLIADEVISRGIIAHISHTSVGTVLKKANLNRGKKNAGASPQKKTPPS